MDYPPATAEHLELRLILSGHFLQLFKNSGYDNYKLTLICFLHTIYHKNYSKQKWVIVCVVVEIVADAAADTIVDAVVDATGITNRFHRLTVFGKPMTLKLRSTLRIQSQF